MTPYYLMTSTLLQPELSAAVVGLKTPARVVADARRSLEFMLGEVEDGGAGAAGGRARGGAGAPGGGRER